MILPESRNAADPWALDGIDLIKPAVPENVNRKGVPFRAFLSWDRCLRMCFGRFNTKIYWFASGSFMGEVRCLDRVVAVWWWDWRVV